jgi:hypothetical protein
MMQEPNIYSFRYKGEPEHWPKQIGPMAQDVAKVFSDKVASIGGYLHIRLDDLPPGITLNHFYKTVRPADESGWPAARALWAQIFAHWDKQKDKT